MEKRTLIAIMLCLALSLSMGRRATADGAPPEDLEKADWSVNAAHNLASNPPSLDAVQDFECSSFGDSKEECEEFALANKVCEFRFADLRNSGNLSLIMSVAGGSWGCNLFYIFDRTPKGFELYSPTAADVVAHDLANSVLDINHDGRHELVLWGDLAPYATGWRGPLGCDAEWPLIFAWTGNGYSEVGDQYKDYYRNYLKSVDARLAAYSSELTPPTAAQTANPVPNVGNAMIAPETRSGPSASFGGVYGIPSDGANLISGPAPTPEPAPTPGWAALNQARRDYPCTRIEVAKTKAFLGINSASTMSAAIKDSESDAPYKRILGAAIFSLLGSKEAKQDLKTLSNDADSKVADVAKTAASFGEDPNPMYRTIKREGAPGAYIESSGGRQSKH